MATKKNHDEFRLKVGDVVRRAKHPPFGTQFLPKEFGEQTGVIVKVNPNGGSGARPAGSVRVRWLGGKFASEATHDAQMIYTEEEIKRFTEV